MLTVFLILILLKDFPFCENAKNPHHSAKRRLFPGRVVPRFEYMSNCNDSVPVQFKNVRFQTNHIGVTEFINSDLEIQRQLNKPITKVITQIKNCPDSTLVSCEVFATWIFHEETCALIEAKDAFWESIINSVKPPIKCPIKASKYVLRNATFNMRLLSHLPIPLEKYYWRVRVMGFDPDLFGCVDGGGRFTRTFT